MCDGVPWATTPWLVTKLYFVTPVSGKLGFLVLYFSYHHAWHINQETVASHGKHSLGDTCVPKCNLGTREPFAIQGYGEEKKHNDQGNLGNEHR